MGKTEGKLGLLLMGGAMLSKSLIQFSFEGRYSKIESPEINPGTNEHPIFERGVNIIQ